MQPDNVILLDYGGVLGYDHLINNEILLSLKIGITLDELNKRTSEKSNIGRAFRENRVSEVEFWRTVAQSDSISSENAKVLTKMWMDTYSLNNEMMRYIQTLRTQRTRVGVLTNIDIARSKLLEKILEIDKNLDYYFPSYQFGYSKDSSSLWNILKNIFLNFKNVIYVDDRIEHIKSAIEIGWIGIKYSSLSDLTFQINSLLHSTIP